MSLSTKTVIKTKIDGSIANVILSNPPNAMGTLFWKDYRNTFIELSTNNDVRCIIVTAEGKFFTVGLDLKDQSQSGTLFNSDSDVDPARKAFHLKHHIAELQDTFTAMERCPQPVITCIHGACIGGGFDLVLASDIRLATKQAWFSIKEVDIGLAADVGTLQRISKVVGNESLVRELAFTARKFDADEALSMGMLSKVLPDRESLEKYAWDMAKQIVSKSPVGITGTKVNLLYSRDHPVKESLDYMATWNSSMLQTRDIGEAAMASITKTSQPKFSKL